MGVKPLHVSFDKMDGFIKIYDGTRYLVSFGPERYNGVYDRIRYLTIEKSGIKYRLVIILQGLELIYIILCL